MGTSAFWVPSRHSCRCGRFGQPFSSASRPRRLNNNALPFAALATATSRAALRFLPLLHAALLLASARLSPHSLAQSRSLCYTKSIDSSSPHLICVLFQQARDRARTRPRADCCRRSCRELKSLLQCKFSANRSCSRRTARQMRFTAVSADLPAAGVPLHEAPLRAVLVACLPPPASRATRARANSCLAATIR